MDDARRATLGFPTTGQAWDLLVRGSSRARPSKSSDASEGPWSGQGRLPILSFA